MNQYTESASMSQVKGFNPRNAHILKTWLEKAADSFVDRECLSWAYIFNYRGDRVAMSADGYRLHVSWQVPARLRSEAHDFDDGNYIIEYEFSEEIKKAEKWLPKLEISTGKVLEQAAPECSNEYQVNPRLMLNALHRIIHVPDKIYWKVPVSFENNILTLSGGECGAKIGAGGTTSFIGWYNPVYLLDALWIHYRKPLVTIRVNTGEHPIMSIGTVGEQIAVVMPFNNGSDGEES